jgi:hypothetical protein
VTCGGVQEAGVLKCVVWKQYATAVPLLLHALQLRLHASNCILACMQAVASGAAVSASLVDPT